MIEEQQDGPRQVEILRSRERASGCKTVKVEVKMKGTQEHKAMAKDRTGGRCGWASNPDFVVID